MPYRLKTIDNVVDIYDTWGYLIARTADNKFYAFGGASGDYEDVYGLGDNYDYPDDESIPIEIFKDYNIKDYCTG